jgi:hypothetical protein
MTWQAVLTARNGGTMVCGTTGATETDAMRNLARAIPAGRFTIASLTPIPPHNER